MMRPGDRLRALAARTCSADSMARLVDPVIADMQAEHAQALREARLWRSRWVRVAGYIAFAEVFVMCEWSAAGDTRPLLRAVGVSFFAIAVVTALLVEVPYRAQMEYAPTRPEPWRVAMFLLPQALSSSIPVGLAIGVALGLAGQRASARLASAMAGIALVFTLVAIVNVGWLVPNANQAFRTAMFMRMSQTPPPKGDNELTFAELERLIERGRVFPVGSYEWEKVARVRVGYHSRWAVAFATLTLPLFALSLLPWLRKRWAIGTGMVVAIFCYYVFLYVGRLFVLSGDLAPPMGAWLANAVFVIAALALITLGARQRHPATARVQG